jgi:hypothetical protein
MKEKAMNSVHHQPLTDSDATAEVQRQAYNAAFEELGLNWQWDRATFEGMRALGPQALRAYLHEQQPHLLRAYDCDFLVEAIESAKSRYCATMRRVGPAAAPRYRAGGSNESAAARSR